MGFARLSASHGGGDIAGLGLALDCTVWRFTVMGGLLVVARAERGWGDDPVLAFLTYERRLGNTDNVPAVIAGVAGALFASTLVFIVSLYLFSMFGKSEPTPEPESEDAKAIEETEPCASDMPPKASTRCGLSDLVQSAPVDEREVEEIMRAQSLSIPQAGSVSPSPYPLAVVEGDGAAWSVPRSSADDLNEQEVADMNSNSTKSNTIEAPGVSLQLAMSATRAPGVVAHAGAWSLALGEPQVSTLSAVNNTEQSPTGSSRGWGCCCESSLQPGHAAL